MKAAIYLDNSATTKVRREVVEAMLPYLSQEWGNPSSLHQFGRQANQALQSARQAIASLLNSSEQEVYFSPCGTYSNNTAILGRARFAEANGLGKHLITCQIEHPAVIGPAKYLESLGWRVSYLPVNNEGLINPQDLKNTITSDTSIISLMWANNEIGTVQPISVLADIASEKGIYFHTDAVQIPGKLPIDLTKVKVSSLSLSGHKFYGPKGIGVLYLRKNVNLMPIVFGGGQEHGLFPGTEGLANIVGIGKAAELAREELEMNSSTLRSIQEILIKSLLTVDGLRITGAKSLANRLPGHVSIVVPGGDGEAMVLRADLKGISISSGSACHKGIKTPSDILTATGVTASDAMGSLRISAGRFNTPEQCETAAKQLVEMFHTIRTNPQSSVLPSFSL